MIDRHTGSAAMTTQASFDTNAVCVEDWPEEGIVFDRFVPVDGSTLDQLCKGSNCVNSDYFAGCAPGTLRVSLDYAVFGQTWHLMHRLLYKADGWNGAFVDALDRRIIRLYKTISFAEELGLSEDHNQFG
jgi:hypothetical protein